MNPALPNPQAHGDEEPAHNAQDGRDDLPSSTREERNEQACAPLASDEEEIFWPWEERTTDNLTPPPDDDVEWWLHVGEPDEESDCEPPENADELLAAAFGDEQPDAPAESSGQEHAGEPADPASDLKPVDDMPAPAPGEVAPQTDLDGSNLTPGADHAGEEHSRTTLAIESMPPAQPEESEQEAEDQLMVFLIDVPLADNLPEIEREEILACLDENEDGDARLFGQLFHGRCLYDHNEGAWYLWQGHFWSKDKRALSLLLVCEELPYLYKNLIRSMANDTRRETLELVKRLTRRVSDLRTVARAKRVLELAQSILPITSEQWDTHPWLLGTPNGVINLRTGELRPGRPEDFVRTVIPTRWRGLDAPAPLFELFLHDIFADRTDEARAELIAFLQRVLGYGITGRVSEHLFLMLYGEEGRNGKDTLMSILKYVLGKTVGAVSNDVLIASGRNASPGAATSHMCKLQGKRIAWASETSQGARFDIGQVKFLTGGGAISARELYGKEFAFEPSHLLILLTNHKPHADASDAAFWERLCLVNFNQRFVDQPTRPNERKRDTTLGAALEAEASGILAWLVRGCLDWQRFGLNLPPEIRQARRDYLEEEDTLGDFIRECCILAPEASTSASQLYDAYKAWATDNGLKVLSNKTFGMQMKKRVKQHKNSKRLAYLGIALEA